MCIYIYIYIYILYLIYIYIYIYAHTAIIIIIIIIIVIIILITLCTVRRSCGSSRTKPGTPSPARPSGCCWTPRMTRERGSAPKRSRRSAISASSKCICAVAA